MANAGLLAVYRHLHAHWLDLDSGWLMPVPYWLLDVLNVAPARAVPWASYKEDWGMPSPAGGCAPSITLLF